MTTLTNYFEINSADIKVCPIYRIDSQSWKSVLVLTKLGTGAVTIIPAVDAIDQMWESHRAGMEEFFTAHPEMIALAEFWTNTAYLSRAPIQVQLGLTPEQLARLSLDTCASCDVRELSGAGSVLPAIDPDTTYVMCLSKEATRDSADDNSEPAAIQTSADDSSSQGSESSTRSSGAGVSSNPLIPLNQLDNIANLCTEFSELKASLTHFRNDCALICEYARTASELADKLAALQPSPAVARTRKPRAGKKVEPAAPSSTGNSVLDAL